jgi:uncharacterized protein (UPF0332 family)
MSSHIRRAQEALRSARLLLEAGDLEGSANRAYYAVYHAARAAVAQLTAANVTDIKTHRGLRRLFELYVVKPGFVSREVARGFNNVESTRIAADYEDSLLQRLEVEAALRDAELFVESCEKLIQEPKQ